MSNETKSVPVAACRFDAAAVEFGDNGENAKTAPFRMVARTGDAIDHWYWGKVVHDLDGMQLHKQRLPIDYLHDGAEVIGYANHFGTDSGDLEVGGALVPYRENDRASEIVHKQRNGVPYEASIDFSGGRTLVEEVPEGVEVDVNGRQFAGPISVIRQWSLRGVAICPYGADMNTSTTFNNAETTQEVNVMATEATKENQPETEEATLAAEAVETETENDTAEAEVAVDATPVVDAAVPTAEATEPAELAEENPGQKFLDAFGDQGGVWFAQGKTFDECQSLFVESLRSDNEKLRSQVEALSAGEETPVGFKAEAADGKKPKTFADRFANVGR